MQTSRHLPSPSATYSDHQPVTAAKISGGLSRSNSLRAASSSSNWKTLFPSLTRTPSNHQQQNIGAGITITIINLNC